MFHIPNGKKRALSEKKRKKPMKGEKKKDNCESEGKVILLREKKLVQEAQPLEFWF